MRTQSLLLLAGASLFAAVVTRNTCEAAPKAKAGKSTAACGATILPLVEGNNWTYSQGSAAIPEATAKTTPAMPKSFVITVDKIEQSGADTIVHLSEKYTYDFSKDPRKPTLEDRTVNTTITCNDKKFDISPDSFFFSAEAGGYLGMKIEDVQKKGTTWQLKGGTFGEQAWADDLTFKWTKVPHEKSSAKPITGKLEMERRFQPAEPEKVITKVAVYEKAEKLIIQVTGRVTLDAPLQADAKPFELPKDLNNALWFVTGTGVVQSLNSYGQQFVLVDSNVK
ncbi:MAG TPA: hypothetical protein VGM90_37665 [Kofleriaceae bacterium]|jgi:hypothetical protein